MVKGGTAVRWQGKEKRFNVDLAWRSARGGRENKDP